MRVLLVAGARPNFMKVAPVLQALDRAGAHSFLVHSGQHYDAAMSDVFFDDLGIRPPDAHLGSGPGSHAQQTARIMMAFEPVLDEADPDVVVVVGDVNSTVACGLVAAKAGRRVAHVEAGLRSRDWSMPEEINRVVTDRLSDLLLAPSEDAAENLRSEGYREDQIHVVGNVMVDTLLNSLERARARPTLADHGLEEGSYGLVTLHRPSNVDDPVTLRSIVGALAVVAERIPLVFPAHPRTRGHLDQFDLPPTVSVIDPAGYLDFVALQAGARFVLTDSGGVQEETTMLGVPCLTARESTERPITIEQGSNTLVGTDPNVIAHEVARVLDSPETEYPRPHLWDGKASERVVEVLQTLGPDSPRPTDVDVPMESE